jgi:hypothetical protein
MLGDLWRPSYPLVLPTTLSIVAMCAGTGAGVGLHALGAARYSLRFALIASAVLIVFSLSGAAAGGALGTVSGGAVASWLGTLIGWWYFRKALRELGTVPVPKWLLPSRSGKKGGHRRSSAVRRSGARADAAEPQPTD